MNSVRLPKTRVILADDHPGILHEIIDLLHGEFEIVGTARDGPTLLKEGCRLKPDVVVTDIRMPGINGIRVGHDLLEARACKAVVVLSMYGDAILAQTALEAGIRGYVLKMTAGDDLIPAIHKILAGGTFFSQPIGFELAVERY